MFFEELFRLKLICAVLVFFVHYTKGADDEEVKQLQLKFQQALEIASTTTVTFIALFDACMESAMSNMPFSLDNIQQFIGQPARTTVGFMTKYTNNRKFFANLITTPQFKEMLAKDEEEIRKKFIKKMKYCDESVMDPNVLRDFYDKEVDQSKVK